MSGVTKKVAQKIADKTGVNVRSVYRVQSVEKKGRFTAGAPGGKTCPTGCKQGDEEYQPMKANIALEYDIAKPIALWKERPDTIVDGHHRYRAWRELGIEPVVVVKSFKSVNAAVLYALKGYLTGRELLAGQRMIAVKQMLTLEDQEVMDQEAREQQRRGTSLQSSNLGAGPAPRSEPTNEIAETKKVAHKIAEKAGVSVRTVYDVQSVEKKGLPEVMGMIESGTLGTTDARTFVNITPKDEQAG
jgi:hypothetical protein